MLLQVWCFKKSNEFEKITSWLAHANSAVILSAVKVLMKLMDILPIDSDLTTTLTKMLALPLPTLLSTEPKVPNILIYSNLHLFIIYIMYCVWYDYSQKSE